MPDETVEIKTIAQETKNKYWPSQEEYEINITKDEWKKYIEDVELPAHTGCIRMLKDLMQLGGEASCKKLSEVYGGHPTSYASSAYNIGRRAKKYFNLPPCMEGNIERFFPIPVLGRTVNENGTNYYAYKIRDELLAALKEIDLSGINLYAPKDDAHGYWWLNADPEIWSFSDFAIGEEQSYTLYNDNGNPRKIFQNFLDAKVGDMVIGYESTPVKKIVAIAKISKEQDGQVLYIEKVEDLSSPIDYSRLKHCPELKDMEFFKNPHGSLFKVTKEEYDFIYKLVQKPKQDTVTYQNKYSNLLIESKNIIFRGAPGTGKTYLAKQIAADIISKGKTDKYEELTPEQKEQVEFVQFHPSYDYTDFVEGLRPITNDNGTMGFELQDGIFKKFVRRARDNYEDSKKSEDVIKKELSVNDAIEKFFSDIEYGTDTFETLRGSKFTITGVDDKHIDIYIPSNTVSNTIRLNKDEVRDMLLSGKKFEKVADITTFFNKANATQNYSYDLSIFNEIKKLKGSVSKSQKQIEKLEYIFIIDEINRGEISKIFGELFFAIDPEYRGKKGEISTQYSNLHENDDKFYIPENVYIIGTMNDIDRSVDTFDFAMRRRFRFIEIKAEDTQYMLDCLKNKDEIKRRMDCLNDAILHIGLNRNYQIGGSYFKKLESLDSKILWNNYLEPLLEEYVRGMDNENKKMEELENAYNVTEPKNKSDENDSENN